MEITPPDIKLLVIDIDGTLLTPEREMEGTKEDEVIERIIHGIEIPR